MNRFETEKCSQQSKSNLQPLARETLATLSTTIGYQPSRDQLPPVKSNHLFTGLRLQGGEVVGDVVVWPDHQVRHLRQNVDFALPEKNLHLNQMNFITQSEFTESVSPQAADLSIYLLLLP